MILVSKEQMVLFPVQSPFVTHCPAERVAALQTATNPIKAGIDTLQSLDRVRRNLLSGSCLELYSLLRYMYTHSIGLSKLAP